MKNHPICAGDLVRALQTLKPRDEAARNAIVRALGGMARGSESGAAIAAPAKPTSDKRPLPRKPVAAPATHGDVTIQTESPAGLEEKQFRLLPLPTKAATAPIQLIVQPAAAPLPSSGPESELPPPPYTPLLNPQWSRAIVSTMARVRSSGGPVDLDALVKQAAERRPMMSLPSLGFESASGADVLLDIGDSMTVFTRDQEHLVAMMRSVLGSGSVSVYRFQGSPARMVQSAADFELRRYRPPRPGWPVILVSDLGAGAGLAAAPALEWRHFAATVRAAGCSLLALVPYPPSRWPAGIASIINTVQWDRKTSVRTIRAVLGRAKRGVR